jgi:hypothetical protein
MLFCILLTSNTAIKNMVSGKISDMLWLSQVFANVNIAETSEISKALGCRNLAL